MARLYISLVGLSLIWGMSFVFIKWLVDPVGVWGTVFLRCLAGALVLLPIFFIQRKKGERKPLPLGKLTVVGIGNAALPWTLIALSETAINSNTASILNATTPIWTGLIGFLLFSVVLTGFQWIGIIVGFIGILVLMNFEVSGIFSSDFVGVGTMVLATMSYAFASQFTKKYLTGTSVVTISTFQLLIGAFAGFIGMMLTNPISVGDVMSGEVILGVLGLGCLGSGVATLLYFYIMTKGSPEFASTVTYLIPGTAMIWGFLLLQEPVTHNLLLGLVIIFVGVFLSSRKSKKVLTSLPAGTR
ncbi:DMT family transporter [Bacillus sp. KH172YL63]|uniref:DMT family transporter n=1 Tax=Bacillus sp. KH172YL63 TaxID=2709784 RepID=UPI0013E41B0A|nr:DMT family transporter [Bacillus sp. KH172YL63]BCB05724.1 multidrug DMT transporter permease [Bacillus sp. KH172YL63]